MVPFDLQIVLKLLNSLQIVQIVKIASFKDVYALRYPGVYVIASISFITGRLPLIYKLYSNCKAAYK